MGRATLLLVAAVALLGAAPPGEPGRRAATAPTATAGPPAPPPGLARLALPEDRAGIAALLAALPATVAGQRVNGPPRVAEYGAGFRVTYGPPANDRYPGLALAVSDVTNRTADVATVARFVEVAGRERAPDAEGGYWHVQTAGWVGDLVWLGVEQADASTFPSVATPLVSPVRPRSRPLFHLWWGRPGSTWLFGITAVSPDARDALLAAFVAAARTGGLA